MKIVCLNPPFKTEHGRFSRTSRSPAVTKSGTIYYPIWLAYIVGILEQDGHDVKLIDSCAYEYDLKKTLEIISQFKPQIAILDTSTPSIYSDVNIGADIKKSLPQCFVLLMGTHPTALPEESLELNHCIDAVAVGEADYIVRDLAQKLSQSDIPKICKDSEYRSSILSSIDGLAYNSSNGVCINKKRALIENLDEIPFVSKVYKKHLDVNRYFFAASDYPEIQIMTARGCVAKCSFCVYPQTIHGLKYRTRSAKNIADEFEWIVNNLPQVREIGIEDDTFTGAPKRVIDFCKELIERKIKIKWYCNVRVDLKYEVMQWMKKAGCVLLTVGYESADKDILEAISKRVAPEMILEFSKNTQRAGLLVHGCFMAGNRKETKETLAKSLELALKLCDDTMQFFPLMVYPGTRDYDWAKKEGLLTVENYSDYVTDDGNHNSVLKMPDMTSDEIRNWCDYARRKYYLRPRYIWYKLLQQILHPSQIRRTMKSAKRFIRYLIPRGQKC
ncbi:MAG: radical SAM protein [Planctomycetes bacterium]|nr:radical SAM protein [Planctomycetota bacterium]